MKQPARIDTRTSLEKLGGLLDVGRQQFGGLLGAIPVVGQIEAIERALRAAGQGNMTGVAEAAADVIPVGRIATQGIKALTKGKSTGLLGDVMNIDAYHGTPHKLKDNRFDSSKIGTGEGAQAYGHGIYLAESPDVARTYAPRDPNYEKRLMQMYKDAERKGDWDSLSVIEDALIHKLPSELREVYGDIPLINKIASIPQDKSSLYKVDLPDPTIAKMIDYDAIASDAGLISPNEAKKMVKAWEKRTGEKWGNKNFYEQSGGELYGTLSDALGSPVAASDYLRSAGATGIRYRDADSRTADGGTSNFVVFPQEAEKLRILERNGIPVMGLQDGQQSINLPNFERLLGLLEDSQ